MTVQQYFAAIVCLTGICTGAFAQQKTTIQVKNEINVNTPGLDFSPTFYEDGIVFISTNTAGAEKLEDENLKLPTMSILHSRRDTAGVLGVPEIFNGKLLSKYHDGPVCFSPTGDHIYFSRNILVDGKEKLSSDGKQKMRLYAAPKMEGGWADPADLKFNNGEFDDCHPALNIDGDKLYFASNRPGGFGGMDLYVSFRQGDGWSEPVNLGAKINSAGNEVFPFIHADNTLYFASDGHGGQGGLDIFQSKMEKGDWGKPLDLPKPFNSKGDDFGLIIDLNKINGYFSSNGSGGQGQDDIFSFSSVNGTLDDFISQENQDEVDNLDFIVTVIDQSSNKPLPEADVRILSMDLGDVIGRDESGNLITVVNVDGQDILKSIPMHAGLSGISDKKGRYGTTLKPGNYSLTVSLEGYQTTQLNVQVKEGSNKLTVPLSKVKDKVQWSASVFNYLTNEPLSGATAVITNTATGKRDTILTDENGRIQYYLDPNSKYKVDLYQGGLLVGSTNVDSGPLGAEPLTQNISVAPLLPGSVLELPNIYYNYNDASLRPDARKDLDIVVALMKQHQGVNVELASHTDSRGTDNYNQQLSQRRANGVVEYLVTKGISRNRLLPVGYGESRPRNNCTDGIKCGEQDHARNRRTEIKMITGVEGSALIYLDGKLNPGAQGDPQPITESGTTTIPVKQFGGTTPAISAGAMLYYVVAGSFSQESNAQNRLSALKSAGFGQAEIIQFEGSPFYSVCVQRFENRKEAEQLENRIEKKNKMDAFVRQVAK